ncbi:MAG: hypothetical protein RL328_137 [Acidobacteriota bacterium]|jgi:hypothetical protein
MLVRTAMFAAGIKVPTIDVFTLSSPTKASGCAPVVMSATWTISNPDNTTYKLVIAETGVEFNCASVIGTSVETANYYEDGITQLVQPTLTLQVVVRADSTVIDTKAAICGSSIYVGPAC